MKMRWCRSWGLLVCLAMAAQGAQAQQSRFATGFEPSSEGFKKSLVRVPRFRASLPVKVDLSAYLPPVGNQGNVGSCLAWATTYYMRSYYEGQQRGRALTRDEAFSPAYVFNLTRNPRGQCGGGTSFEAAQNVLRTKGAASWRDFPYSDRQCPPPDFSIDSVAAMHRIDELKTLSEDLDDIKGRLSKGHVVAFAMNVPASFDDFTGGGVYNDTRSSAPPNSAHAMLLVGYDDERQAFRLVNSWGTDWGDKGFMWIGYDSFKHLRISGEQYVMGARDWPAPKLALPAPPEPAPAPSPVPVKPAFDPAATGEQVMRLASAVDCARIKAQVSDKGEVGLSGFAGSADELAGLVKSVSSLAGVARVKSEVSIHAWPKCEVYVHFDSALKYGKGLLASFPGGKDGFADGASMAVDVTSPAYPSYLYVSYLQAGGDVVHLAWPRPGAKPTPPNTRLTFGGGKNGQPVYRIGPPFGEEMVIVVASASPLLKEDLPRNQDDRAYLSLFRTAFMKAARDKSGQNAVSAYALPLKTFPAQ